MKGILIGEGVLNSRARYSVGCWCGNRWVEVDELHLSHSALGLAVFIETIILWLGNILEFCRYDLAQVSINMSMRWSFRRDHHKSRNSESMVRLEDPSPSRAPSITHVMDSGRYRSPRIDEIIAPSFAVRVERFILMRIEHGSRLDRASRMLSQRHSAQVDVSVLPFPVARRRLQPNL